MDDRKVSELIALKLAYKKQLFIAKMLFVIFCLGIVLYLINLYVFNFQALLMSISLILVGIIGLITIDKKIKLISEKIRKTN